MVLPRKPYWWCKAPVLRTVRKWSWVVSQRERHLPAIGVSLMSLSRCSNTCSIHYRNKGVYSLITKQLTQILTSDPKMENSNPKLKNWERKWKTGSQNEKLGAKLKMYINWDPKMENWERKCKTGFRKWKNIPMIILIIIIFGVDFLSWPFLTFGGLFGYCRCM